MGENVRKLQPGRLIIASHNSGKIREIKELLETFDIDATSAKELGLTDPEETGKTFAANAKIKALASARSSGLPALADDSGLEVAAIGGNPGIYSARWAETPQGRDFRHAMIKIEQGVQASKSDDARARFVCALCVAWPDAHTELFEGEIWGALSFPPRGNNGFGYDPIFIPSGYDITFGEMNPAQKHAMSHRADAFRKLTKSCLGND